MRNNPLVSVIIPAYNCERFIEQSVRSIMTQTYKNLEILITDDCSTDGTYKILEKLAKEDSRIKLFKNEKNLKIVQTLNRMIDFAQGELIARMDADDVSFPERIEKQVLFLTTHEDYVICGTNAFHINEYNRIKNGSYLPITNDDINIFKSFLSPFYHPAVMIRARILKDNKYDEEFMYAEDYELWLRILRKYKGCNLKNKLFYYRIINTSISNSGKSKVKQQLLLNQLSNPVTTEELQKIKDFFVLGNLIYCYIKNKKGRIKNIIKVRFLLPLIVFLFFDGIQRIYYKVVKVYV